MKNKIKFSPGFSLVELMVSLVAGLIVIGAVGAFTISSLQSNAEYIQSTRLTQELRSTMDFTSRELRRAGYDETAVEYMLRTIATPSPFAPILVPGTYTNNGAGANTRTSANNDCIIYAYDRSGGTAGTLNLANGEIRGLRRTTTTVNGLTVGVIEMAESSAGVTPSCTGAAVNYTTYPATCSSNGWCALSDPRQLNVTSFDLDMTSTPNIFTNSNQLLIREIDVSIDGTLPGQPDVVRGVQSSIKIRSDCIRNTPCVNATACEVVTRTCESSPTGT